MQNTQAIHSFLKLPAQKSPTRFREDPQKYSHPQGSDPVWNSANCRNRRIFNDRTGLSAGRSTRPFLLQTYRRDMGGGHFVLMKDVSAPIMVHGRHWGGFRIGFKA
jgi:methyl-accepting chemotaxis protein